MITVGELDTPIRIEANTYGANANYGGVYRETWADAGAGTIWCYRIFKGGRESEEGDQMVGSQKVDFYIRYESYKDTLKQGWRIRYNLNDGDTSIANYIYYYIEKIAHIDGRHRITRLTAVEKDSH